jgi:hypothetical protein
MSRKNSTTDTRKGLHKGGRPTHRKGDTPLFSGGDSGPVKGKLHLKLATIEEARESVAELIKAYAEGRVSENGMRAMTYTARALLDFDVAIRGSKLEEQFAALAAKVEALEAKEGAH